MPLILVQTFPSPINGYWDGGAKKRFEWSIEEHRRGRDAKGEFVRVGSWDANHWFNVSVGRRIVRHSATRGSDWLQVQRRPVKLAALKYKEQV